MIRLKLLIVGLIMNLSINGNCQSIEAPFEIGTWEGYTQAAITYTFDDGCSNQYTVAIPMLNEFDFDATFFPVINWSPNWLLFQEAANQGHEIGSHTVSHTKLSSLNDSEQEVEFKNSQDQINTNISGQKCLTIAYPNCIPGSETLCSKYYIAARHCQGAIESKTPSNFLNISSIVCGSAGSIKVSDDFNRKADDAATLSGWCVYLLHGIDNDGGYSSVSSAELRGSFEYLNNNKDKFWVSTFGKVVRYIRERNSVSLKQLKATSKTIKIQVTDTLDNAIYNQALTFRRPLPHGWSNVSVKQNKIVMKSKMIEINSVKLIQFNAVPDAGVVIISKSKI